MQTKSGADKDVIIDQVLNAITGVQIRFFNPVANARRLFYFYSFFFKSVPIIVIRVPERQMGQNYADVTAAVRALVDTFDLRVIVDGSPNSIPPEVLTTKRQTVMTVEPMLREQVESIPEFKTLMDFLRSHSLDEPVWKVLGGSPSKYLKLKETVKTRLLRPNPPYEEIVELVEEYLYSMLMEALIENIFSSSPSTNEIIEVFRERKVTKIDMADLVAMGLKLDYPNKVFRKVRHPKDEYVEPVSAAVSLIISENIRNKYGVLALGEKLFKSAGKRIA